MTRLWRYYDYHSILLMRDLGLRKEMEATHEEGEELGLRPNSEHL